MTQRTVLLIAGSLIVGGIIGAIAGILLYNQVVGGTGEASAHISAPTLALQSPTPAGFDFAPAATQVAQLATSVQALVQQTQDTSAINALSTQVAALDAHVNQRVTAQAGQSATVLPTAIPTLLPTNTRLPTATATLTLTPSPVPAAAQKLFRIVSEESEARFKVKEVMPPVTAVGATNQIAGDIIVDFANPANSQIGTIRVNLRTLKTDEAMRDSAIRSTVLQTSRPEFEFSDFVPTAITGLPASVNVGDTLNFKVTGDFPIKGVTHSITFDVTLTVVSESELYGLATTVINRTDFDLLAGPLVQHGVDENVTLEFEFVAREVK